jgi:3-oxoacyl-[acyl-carrier protein] reductase
VISIDLRGKTALVTGGGQGLGEETSRLLYAAGANVAIQYLDDPSGGNRIRAEHVVSSLGERAFAVGGDVRDPAAVRRAIEAVTARFGGLEIVVCNAGILRDKTMKKMSQADWVDVIDTNLSGVFYTCQAAAEYLADGGRIILLASLSATMGFFGQANYASAKAGVIAMAKVLSKELARRSITVNAIAPGVILTEMGKSIPDANRQAMISQIPLARFGEPREVANCILFLASDLSSYVTGQTLHVNGGWWAP